MLEAASIYTKDAQTSEALCLETTYLVMKMYKGGNIIPPHEIAIIMAENKHPVGSPPGGSRESNVGTHMKTNWMPQKKVK